MKRTIAIITLILAMSICIILSIISINQRNTEIEISEQKNIEITKMDLPEGTWQAEIEKLENMIKK